MEPVVSVIVPTYKRSVSFLARAINSLLVQTYNNVEIIVIDDSPADYEERRHIEEYVLSLDLSRVKYIQNQTNVGGALARNIGIQHATGAYITFLDDDDEYFPPKIERQVRFMESHDFDLTFSNLLLCDDSGKIVDYRKFDDISKMRQEELLKYHLMKHMTGTPTFMFKAAKLREIGGFDKVKVGQEFHLMFKAILGNLRIGYLPECHVRAYRHNEGGISFGKQKIEGEKALFQFKKNWLHVLNKTERRYVIFRHHAVLAVAYKRNGQYINMVTECVKAFVSSPLNMLGEGIKFVKRVLTYNKEETCHGKENEYNCI